MSAPKSTHSSFTKFCRKLKMDENKTPRKPRALNSRFAILLLHTAASVLGWAGSGHCSCAGRGGGVWVCGCHPSATPFTLATKLSHCQLEEDARGLCSLVARPSTNSGHAEAELMAARELGSRGKLFHVICNNRVTFMPRL